MSNRGYVLLGTNLRFVVEDCFKCGTLFAMTEDLWNRCQHDHSKSFYCPNGHGMVFTGKSDREKLKEAQARETALRDQLDAAVHEAEHVRQALLRDRQRFANGVCPCCNRSFENVRRHMASQHPDYDATRVTQTGTVTFRCSCGRSFESLRGLRTHQGHQRGDNWVKRSQGGSWDRRMAHTTVV